MNSYKKDEQIVEQTDRLEKIIRELTQLTELNYKGYSIETISRFVDEDNLAEIVDELGHQVSSAVGNIRLHLIIS